MAADETAAPMEVVSGTDAASAGPAKKIPLGLGWRLVISGAILFHLSAIFIYPFSTPPASRFALWAMESPVHRHYLQTCYLDHSFKFFAPNPGLSARQIRWELDLPQGAKTEGVFPEKSTHWPRLFYHRHFMLAEHLPVLPADFLESYARHLMKTHGAKRAVLYERLHFIPVLEEAQRGLKIDDPRLYSERRIGEYKASEVF